MHPTLLVIILGALAAALCFALRLRAARLSVRAALTTLPLSAVLGAVLGKCVYVLCLISRLYPRYGMGAFTRLQLTEFSFVGVMAGVMLGAWIAARLHKIKVRPLMDAFAPAYALFAACIKGSEYFLGTHGVGAYLENESLYFFPLAVKNEWDEYFLAVFMLYAILALLVLIVSFAFGKKVSRVPGLLMNMTVYHLAIGLMLCENLRVQTIKWGFVKAEQLFGAIICLIVLVRVCYATFHRKGEDGPAAIALIGKGMKRCPFISRWWPIAALFACAGLLIVVEFALDGKIAIPTLWAYVLMGATLVSVSGLFVYAARRLLKTSSIT